jgi:hypothetical protein
VAASGRVSACEVRIPFDPQARQSCTGVKFPGKPLVAIAGSGCEIIVCRLPISRRAEPPLWPIPSRLVLHMTPCTWQSSRVPVGNDFPVEPLTGESQEAHVSCEGPPSAGADADSPVACRARYSCGKSTGSGRVGGDAK